MSPVTHFVTGWVIANAAPLNRRERVVVTFAAVAPDVDGLGIIPELVTRHAQHPLLWFSRYHHSLHTLLFAVIIAVLAFFMSGRRWMPASFAFLAFHAHLVEDLVGSRGPDGYLWPIPYLFPFSERWTWAWEGQWKLNAWPNVAVTLALLCLTILMALRRGFSPVSIFSRRADKSVVAALRNRFGNMGATASPGNF
jgi:inner membrane protein